ncbi:hypothetical protein E4O05_05325 [Treponema sp. OMZ 787]|uniref:hypothetical protein n=1 Tax=Treponema sp. OMZ 787 TaxID=2563669 RepID=UPI0020A3DF4D|nr:hypothetical protein [Treponema sp. OMZ 787]UTC63307.1 hypothetical protein E4O05_05325 [Treponema sp. OMZ 787]
MDKNEIIKSINAEGFAKDLMNFIFDYGLGTYSKTDTYDYIVYLANKYSKEAFFDANSNFDNALLFKVSETKIKNTRQNIALKFKDEERQNVFADFLSKLHDNKIKVKFDDDKTFTFFIEDPFVRMTLEGLLKKNQGITIDYSFNRELIKIKREDFITLLIEESAKGNKDEKNNKDGFVKSLQKQLTTEKLKALGIKTFDILVSNLNITELFIPIVKTALSFM